MCARCPDLETKVNKGRGNSTVRAHVRVFSVENGEFEILKKHSIASIITFTYAKQ